MKCCIKSCSAEAEYEHPDQLCETHWTSWFNYRGVTLPEKEGSMEPKIRFRHYHSKNGRLLATLVTRQEQCSDRVEVAVAICNKEDSPSRARGRAIALGRVEQAVTRLDKYRASGDEEELNKANKLAKTIPLAEVKQKVRTGELLRYFGFSDRAMRKIRVRPPREENTNEASCCTVA